MGKEGIVKKKVLSVFVAFTLVATMFSTTLAFAESNSDVVFATGEAIPLLEEDTNVDDAVNDEDALQVLESIESPEVTPAVTPLAVVDKVTWSESSFGDAVFELDLPKENFIKLTKGPKLIDPSKYTVTASETGGTLITLKKDYIETFKKPKHLYMAEFTTESVPLELTKDVAFTMELPINAQVTWNGSGDAVFKLNIEKEEAIRLVEHGGDSKAINESDYTITAAPDGGTLITLKEAYLKTLNINGYYVFRVEGYDRDYFLHLSINLVRILLPDVRVTWKGSGDAAFKIDADVAEFMEFLKGSWSSDYEAIGESNYTVTAAPGGGTLITLKESYLKTLKNGSYMYTAKFPHWNYWLELTVAVENKSDIPKTGDTNHAAGIAVLLGSLVLATVSFRAWRKEQTKA